MVDDTVIPDDLLQQIIAVGQVDVLVGLPTQDLGETVTTAVEAVRGCFRAHFPRLRTALLAIDRGSSDGTPEALQQCWAGTGSAGFGGLRTAHCITASTSAWAEGPLATRTILAAGDLLQAGTVVVLDADVEGLTPAWVAALAASARDSQIDLVAPVYGRHAADGLLVTQLVRPLVRALYGGRLREPLLAEFGCSGRLAARCTQAGWDASVAQRATNFWITAEALRGGGTIRQADIGPRRLRTDRQKRGLPDVFREVVNSVFATIDTHASHWAAVQGASEVPAIRPAFLAAGADLPPSPDGSHLIESFARDVEAIDEILRRILPPRTLDAVRAGSRATPPEFPATLWAATVAQVLVAYHHGAMHRDHVVQALLPLYAARAGVFVIEHGGDGADALEAANEDLGLAFDGVRTEILERWLQPA